MGSVLFCTTTPSTKVALVGSKATIMPSSWMSEKVYCPAMGKFMLKVIAACHGPGPLPVSTVPVMAPEGPMVFIFIVPEAAPIQLSEGGVGSEKSAARAG